MSNVPTAIDNPIRIAPTIIRSVPMFIRLAGVCSALLVLSVVCSDEGSIFFADFATAMKVPMAKIGTPSRNNRSLNITVRDLPKKVPMFSLR